MSASTKAELQAQVSELIDRCNEFQIQTKVNERTAQELGRELKRALDAKEAAMDLALHYKTQRDSLIGYIEGYRDDSSGEPDKRTRLDDYLDMMRINGDHGQKTGLNW